MSLCIPHSPPTRWMQFKLWIHSENWIVATWSLSLSISHSETFSQIYLGFSPGLHTLFLSIPGDPLGQSLSISRGAAPLFLWICPRSPHFSHIDSNLTPQEAIPAVATTAARVAFPKQAGGSMAEWKHPALWPQPRLRQQHQAGLPKLCAPLGCWALQAPTAPYSPPTTFPFPFLFFLHFPVTAKTSGGLYLCSLPSQCL